MTEAAKSAGCAGRSETIAQADKDQRDRVVKDLVWDLEFIEDRHERSRRIASTAESLGLSRRALYRLMRKHGWNSGRRRRGPDLKEGNERARTTPNYFGRNEGLLTAILGMAVLMASSYYFVLQAVLPDIQATKDALEATDRQIEQMWISAPSATLS